MAKDDAFAAGMAAPVIDLVMSILKHMSSQIASMTGGPSFSIDFIAITIVAWVICFVMGLRDTKYAALYAIGSIIGLILFGGTILTMFPEAFFEAVLEVALIILGIGVSVYVALKAS